MRPTTLLWLLVCSLLFATPVQAGGLTICVVDTSRPMQERWGGQRKWDLLTTYVINVVRNVDVRDQVAVIGFGSDRCEPTLLLAQTDALMAASSIEGRLASVVPGGDRALVGGLESALLLASESRADTIRILAFTSGVDQCRENLRSLTGRASRISGLNLQLFGLDMVSDLALELTEGIGQLGGTFRPFDGPEDFTATIGQVQGPSRAGLQVLINAPPSDSGDVSQMARLEVYAEGGRQPIWTQSVSGSTVIDLPMGKYDVMARFGGESRWRRGLVVSGSNPTVVQFDFAQGVGRIRLELADPMGNPVPGDVVIYERGSDVEIARQRGQAQLALDLPPGSYRAEITVGSEVLEQDFEVGEGDRRTIGLMVEAVLGQALISLNNQDLMPVNGDLYLYHGESGDLLETWTSTSSVRASLPAGDYEITARVGTVEETLTFSIVEGDETLVEFELQVPMGSLYVTLRDSARQSVYGTLRVFDSQGNEIKYYELELFEDSDFSFDLPVGTYSLRATVDGVTRTSSSVQVREDEESEVIIEFPRSDRGLDD